MRRALGHSLGAGALAALACAPALAADQAYSNALARRDPAALAAYQRALSGDKAQARRLRKASWAYRLSGVGFPLERRGAQIAGKVCKPHDCAANAVAFIIERARAVALARSADLTASAPIFFGAPSADEKRALGRLLR